MSVSTTAQVMATATPDELNEAAVFGAEQGSMRYTTHPLMREAWDAAFEVQHANGMRGGTRRLLSTPETQHKLALGKVPSYGLTLFHHVMRTTLLIEGRQLVVNSCPSAGDCTRLCVINNNWGRQDSVRLGWRWRTDMFVRYPVEFIRILAFSIARELGKKPLILFRPNINSDIEWQLVVPALVDGTVFGDSVLFYGYSKIPSVLAGDGQVTSHYRVAYSWNEESDPAVVRPFLERGGSVAVVTNRYYGATKRQPVDQWDAPLHLNATVVDGDVSDEWIFTPGVIGDLAFKPDTAAINEWGLTSDFVVKAYIPEVPT